MRFELFLLILLVGLSWAYTDQDRGDAIHFIRKDDRRENEHKGENSERGGIKKRQVSSLATPRDYGDIYNLCDYEDDIDCIRNHFVSTGQCIGVQNHESKIIYRDRLTVYVPTINLTAVFTKTRVQFTGDRISRFYINKTSGNLVMAVDFTNVTIDHRMTTFYYHRLRQEPLKLADYSYGNFVVTLTAVIPINRLMPIGIDIEEAMITSYVASQSFVLGPKIANSREPLAVRVNTALIANVNEVILEYYQAEAPSQFLGYLQKYICDFGLPISSTFHH